MWTRTASPAKRIGAVAPANATYASAAVDRGAEAVADTGKAVVNGVASVGKGIAGLFG